MKGLMFVLVVAALSLAMLPSDRQVMDAFRRSDPRPEAEAYFQRRWEQGVDAADAMRQIIRIRSKLGDASGEVLCREKLLTVAPEDPDNLDTLAAAYLRAGRTADAQAVAERLVRLQPDRRDLRELLLDVCEFAGRPEDAHPHALWLLAHGIRTPRMVRIFTATRDAEGIAAVVASPRERARLLVAIGDHARAIAACREHIALEGGDVETRRLLARLQIWTGHPLEAASELEAILIRSNDPEVRKELIALYRALNRIDLLLPHLPDGPERGDVLLALGRLSEAKAIFERFKLYDKLLDLARGMPYEDDELAIRISLPMTEENRRRLADLYTWRKEFVKALKLYEGLNDPRAIDLYLYQGDRAGAIRMAKRLDLPARLGEMYLWEGNIAAAITQFERVPEMKAELPRLYILVGRREEAIRLLDALTMNPYVKAELYLYAAAADRVVATLDRFAVGTMNLRLVERLAKAADAPTGIRLYQLLLKHSPGNVAFLLALADLYDGSGRKAEAIATLRALLEKDPNNLKLVTRLAVMTQDRAMLERAYALGARDPDIIHALWTLALGEGRKEDAVKFLRAHLALKPDDFESRFVLAELTGDPAEYERTWKSLPAGEKAIRLRILLWRKDLDGALALIRTVNEPKLRELLVDYLLAAGRDAEALALGLTPRQRAVLAIRRGNHAEAVEILRSLDLNDPEIRRALAESLVALGRYNEADDLIPHISARPRAVLAMRQGRYEEAVRLLLKLDLKDPDIRRALAESYLALGHWQDAEKYADPELKQEIRGKYGPEASAAFRLHDAGDETQRIFSARYRMYVLEKLFVRVEGIGASLDGTVLALAEERSASVERAEASAHYQIFDGFRLGGGVGGWNSDAGNGAFGVAEAQLRGASWFAALAASTGEPWLDSIEAASLGGIRDRIQVSGGVSPIGPLYLFGAFERSQLEATDILDGETVDETRAYARAEFLFWKTDKETGRWFYDLPLRHETTMRTHLGVSVQIDASQADGSQTLMDFAQLIPESRALTAGPTAGWADDNWAVSASMFVGVDPAREIEFGSLWGGSFSAMATLGGAWKLGSWFDYVSEQRQAIGGAGWSLTLGLNYNF